MNPKISIILKRLVISVWKHLPPLTALQGNFLLQADTKFPWTSSSLTLYLHLVALLPHCRGCQGSRRSSALESGTRDALAGHAREHQPCPGTPLVTWVRQICSYPRTRTLMPTDVDISVQNDTTGVIMCLRCYTGDLHLVFLHISVPIQSLTQYHLCSVVNILSPFICVQQM